MLREGMVSVGTFRLTILKEAQPADEISRNAGIRVRIMFFELGLIFSALKRLASKASPV
jgi:hypothetical protein